MSLFRTKPIDSDLTRDRGLKRVLGAWDLTLLGVGAVIGAGIFVLTGITAATMAGPAVILSFVLAGVACACAALAYADLASLWLWLCRVGRVAGLDHRLDAAL